MRRRALNVLLVVAMLLVTVTPAFAQEVPDAPVPDTTGIPDIVELPEDAAVPDVTASDLYGPNAVFLPLLANVRELEMAAESVDAAAAAARPMRNVGSLAVPAGGAVETEGAAANGGTPGPRLDPALKNATGRRQIVVQMTNEPVAVVAATSVGSASDEVSAAAADAAMAQQESLLGFVLQRDPSAKVLARLKIALNAVILDVDAALINDLLAQPGVASINAVGKYELDLSETVPHIGAAEAQAIGVDGRGVRVAVLDSGIDYHHWNLGGSGNVADYDANDPTVIEPGTFPTAKVVGGYDFVGNMWTGSDPNTVLHPDPDPLDDGPGGGHGTHVADIIAGQSSDGTHKGVAPAALLYAVKVCSSVSTACSGVALLQGVEFSLDPNGDANVNDAVDVMNLSLGSSYGQKEDDLSLALANAVKAGVVVVASAGNSADRPYIVGSPSSQHEVISVAQTTVPSDRIFILTAEGLNPPVGLNWQPWSAEPVLTNGAIVYDARTAATRIGCSSAAGANPYAAGEHAGRTLLIDRGTCAVSMKVSNAFAAGAVAAIVANNVAQGPGEPGPIFSFGGGNPAIPGYTVTQAEGNRIKALLTPATGIRTGPAGIIDPASAVLIPNTMVASSSRGPNYSFSAIKPDIGAPGASLSAEYGTGDGETAFGGTSGAAPMVAGSAALMLQAFPRWSPAEVKARLMNTGDTDVYINPQALPGYLAPITRIGGGEVRVFDALEATTSAWDADAKTGSLSFGYQALTTNHTFFKRLLIRNYGNQWRQYNLSNEFRYADDAANGAVKISMPNRVNVPPRGSSVVLVRLTVDVSKLPSWGLNGGPFGGDGYRLQGNEYDGYIHIKDSKDSIHVAWQILPRKAAQIIARSNDHHRNSRIVLANSGRELGIAEVFALLGTSPRIPRSQLPGPGDNAAVIDLRAVGARPVIIGGTPEAPVYGLQIGITTFGERAHPAYPAEFDVYLDTNNDGTDDFVLFTAELGAFASTGQTVVYVFNLTTGTATPYFYADADLNSANNILTAPFSAIGLTTLNQQIGISVYAFDNYFTGNLTDAIEGIKYTPGVPRFYLEEGDVIEVEPRSAEVVRPVSVPLGKTASPSQTGLLLLYRNQAPGFEADLIKLK